MKPSAGAARWIVGASDAATLAEVLEKMGDVARGAADEGRAFVNGRRVDAQTALREGDAIEVYAARSAASADVVILARRGGLVVADKPAGLPTTADRRGARSVESEVAAITGGEARAVSRLDVGVSGVVALALDPEAHALVARAREAGRFHRVYLAVATGVVVGEGLWNAPIGLVRARGRDLPTAGAGREAKPAETRYRALAAARGATLLELEPVTGRMHQIRAHAAAAGAPIFGDRDRGGPRTITEPSGRVVAFDRIALHARALSLDGDDGAALEVESAPPAALVALWKALDGDPRAWDSPPSRAAPRAT